MAAFHQTYSNFQPSSAGCFGRFLLPLELFFFKICHRHEIWPGPRHCHQTSNMSRMTEKQNCSSGCGNTEQGLLSDLDDETSSSASEEGEANKTQEDLPKDVPESDQENRFKFEKNTVNKIMCIKSEVEKYKEEILSAEKEVLERDFKKYEEALILKTLSLDNIETKGVGKIKETRKEAILFVQDCLKLLDSKLK